jgi:hypothetical protein
MTKSQQGALKWLADHGGDGSRHGPGRTQILAGGEIAPFMWVTFKALIASGHVEQYGQWRIRLTASDNAVRS